MASFTNVRVWWALCALAACDRDEAVFECTEQEAASLYERRIAPLFADDRPSSCNECHLQGVDLALFVQDTPCETMACMEAQGVVDLAVPEDSLVLAWIDRATPRGGITQDTIDQERAGMLEWIRRSSFCGTEECGEIEDPCGARAEAQTCEIPPSSSSEAAPRPVDDPGDCSDLTLELLWKEKVYSWRGRCFPCHFDSHVDQFAELEEVPPAWITTGACEPGSLATLRNAQELGMLDADDPLQSRLLLKPLDEAIGGIEHGGGPKMHTTDDPAYLDFVTFSTRWADCN